MDKQETEGKKERLPLGQVLLDDIFFLLALGLGIPLILYIVWSIIDIVRVKPFIP